MGLYKDERKKYDEIIYVEPMSLVKAIYFALLYSSNAGNEGNRNFKMVYGLLAGQISEDKVFVKKTFCINHGRENRVEVHGSSYIKIAELSSTLQTQDMFILGWFCSMNDVGTLPSVGNVNNQLGYQSMNAKAVGMQIKPEHFWHEELHDSIKFFRLKDIKAPLKEWIEIPFRLADKKEEKFLKSLEEDYLLFKKEPNLGKISDDELDMKIDEWIEKSKAFD
ncbi:MAG: hypothetical protein GF364_17205 [Candidatus Lokiarchaeota archaeon]|nr:hypothetical protein [Candidatus Lokiarchaeota archaeon]